MVSAMARRQRALDPAELAEGTIEFAESAARGSSVLEDSPEGPAAGEIDAVVNELLAARLETVT